MPHKEQTILDALKVQLEKIVADTGITWASSVPIQVHQLKQDSFSLGYFPHVLIIPLGGNKELKVSAGARTIYDCRLEVWIEGWLRDYDIVNKTSDLLHDIEKAVGLNRTLGGSCIDMRLLGNERFIEDEGRPRSGVRVLIEIWYRHYSDDPAQGAP